MANLIGAYLMTPTIPGIHMILNLWKAPLYGRAITVTQSFIWKGIDMENFSLAEAQAKRSKALHNDKLREYWIWDAMICLHLGLDKVALDSLALAIKQGE